MLQTAPVPGKGNVYSISEPQLSPARRLATQRTVGDGRSLPLRSRVDEAARRLNTVSDSKLTSPQILKWLTDNARLVKVALRSLRSTLRSSAKGMPIATNGAFFGYPRVLEIAKEAIGPDTKGSYLESLGAYVDEYQSAAPLLIRELWALSAFAGLALVEGLADAAACDQVDRVGQHVRALKELGKIEWIEFVEAHSRVEQILSGDPAGTYPRMTPVTREMYREAVNQIAKHSQASENQVAETAIALAAEQAKGAGREARQSHVGYYLIDRGVARLKSGFQYRPSLWKQLGELILKWPTAFYLLGVELFTIISVFVLLSYLPEHLSYLALILLLLATEPALAFMNLLSSALVPPRRLPRLDFSKGIPSEYTTMVVVPTLLISEDYVKKLVADLEVRYLANTDDNLLFTLLTDLPDATEPDAEADAHLVEFCAEAIRSLNARYEKDGRQPFYLLHRDREWNPKEGTWMGWERKRGKLIALNNLLRGEIDGRRDSFDVKIGQLNRLSRVKFVITLDSDTELTRGSARQLAATLAHPLNRAVVDVEQNLVVEGYGLLQPRVGISVSSARRSNLASIYSGQTGFDIYTTAVSDTYQDLFAEGSYCGKGIYDVDALQQTTDERFPQNTLLSHDLIEGMHARAGLVSDIEMIDDYPSHYTAWSKRKHRWVRGDWQIVRWLLPRVPGWRRREVDNPLSVISLWKIVDNLRRSLIEIGVFVLLVAGWTFLPGGPLYWTSVVTILAFLPVYMRPVFSLLHTPLDAKAVGHLKETAKSFVTGHGEVIFQLVFLAHQTCLMLDAIIRSVVRTTVTGRRLLQWESAAQAEMKAGSPLYSINSYLFLAVPLSLAIGAILYFWNRPALWIAWPFLLGWLASPLVALWLNRKLASPGRKVRRADRQFLEEVARRTWEFFAKYSTERDNWLVPDNVEMEGERIAHRTSPTNIGLLLNANLAALDFGFITPEALVQNIQRLLATMERMERSHGHFLNWYDTRTLAPLTPRYVSTVDSGNLAAALIALRQGLLELGDERATRLSDQSFRFLKEMDFGFLLDPKQKLLFTGFNVETGTMDDSHYDLLASEARIASFIGVAKNEIPEECWMRLGRTMTIASGHRVLLSWSGTMFEYLMPSLWLRNFGNTLLDASARGAVNCHVQHGKSQHIPWGVSESASCERVHGDYRYYAFGLNELAIRPDADSTRTVIAPYATALALMVDPWEAVHNMKRQKKRGWFGDLGFYEAADFTESKKRESLVTSYMAHHQGMALIALDNAMNRNRMQKRFHAEPMVKATELLLQERFSPHQVVENLAG